MIYLIIALATIFIAYVVTIHQVYGPLNSISESYYKLQVVNKGWLFTLFMWTIAFSMITLSGIIKEQHVWLFFLSGIGAGFVGAATTFYEKITNTVHYIGSGVLIIGSSLGCWLVLGNWWAPIFIFLSVVGAMVYRYKLRYPIYQVEIFAFIVIILGLLL